uniref:Ig-like domain-containing protein n=1 Tax=Sus scrofa TaxID=9823 RepID=A0A4X1V4U9_PIG
MMWTFLLSLVQLLPHVPLVSVSAGSLSQTVIQEPAMSVSPGGTVTLTCAFSSGSVTTSNYPGWYQQTPGQPPRQLIYQTNSRPTGVPSRFSGAISGNKATLTITGAQAEDEADYFCALEKSSANATVM